MCLDYTNYDISQDYHYRFYFVDKSTSKPASVNGKKLPRSDDATSSDDDRLDVKFFKKAFGEKQRLEQKRSMEVVNQKLGDNLRDLCLPKLLCEIAAKPTYLLTDKEKHVLSLLK